MNISTYEARIAALEAQLGPGPETGLVSMVVTPNILLSDGKTINEKLAELLPKTTGDENLTFETTADQIPVTTNFNVEAAPGNEWYAVSGFVEDQPTFGEKGEKTSRSFTPYSEGDRELILAISGFAASTNNPSGPSLETASLNILISAPLL